MRKQEVKKLQMALAMFMYLGGTINFSILNENGTFH